MDTSKLWVLKVIFSNNRQTILNIEEIGYSTIPFFETIEEAQQFQKKFQASYY